MSKQINYTVVYLRSAVGFGGSLAVPSRIAPVDC